jgi:hypothetical protein
MSHFSSNRINRSSQGPLALESLALLALEQALAWKIRSHWKTDEPLRTFPGFPPDVGHVWAPSTSGSSWQRPDANVSGLHCFSPRIMNLKNPLAPMSRYIYILTIYSHILTTHIAFPVFFNHTVPRNRYPLLLAFSWKLSLPFSPLSYQPFCWLSCCPSQGEFFTLPSCLQQTHKFHPKTMCKSFGNSGKASDHAIWLSK